ncbi:MAG: CPBP family intramembrane metalloprotease [Clostridia bacterium]|nr:CPBP family intramembrane metalloprotease [Clostridia bacterium]
MFGKEAYLGRSTYRIQFLSLLLIIVLSILFFNIFGLALALPIWGNDLVKEVGNITNYDDPTSIGFLKYVQLINQLGFFFFPPLLFAFLVHRRVMDYLKLNVRININQIFLGILLIFVSVPFIAWLGVINHKMVLPEFLSGIENWMKTKEGDAMKLTKIFIQANSFGTIIVNMLLIAVIPAIGEELLFRGVLIRFFKKWSGHIHLAVILSSFLFSALHLQFYGFLPRFALGLILGYSFVWTGSLWVPIILHFVNNGSVLAIFYATNSEELLTGEKEILVQSDNTIGVIISILLTLSLCYLIYKQKKSRFQV